MSWQLFSGTDDQATDRFSIAGGLTIVDLSHAASDEHFGVGHLDVSGQRQDLLVNEIGPTGEVSTVFNAQGVWFVQVESSGKWTRPVEAA